jgi:WD40 repeat protein
VQEFKGHRLAYVWDARAGQRLQEFKGHTHFVEGLAFSPDGQRLATGSADKTARVWDVRTGQQVQACMGHTGRVSGLAFIGVVTPPMPPAA